MKGVDSYKNDGAMIMDLHTTCSFALMDYNVLFRRACI